MATRAHKWSRRVTTLSRALDLEPKVFSGSAPAIARSLKRSAERSENRRTSPYRSAMSMLTFYVNRAGAKLPQRRRSTLEAAKDELRRLFHKRKR